MYTLTLSRTIELLKKKSLSLEEVYKSVMQKIKNRNRDLNVYLWVHPHPEKEAQNKSGTCLWGLPIAVKDNFSTRGIQTTASSNVLRGYIPPYESTVTQKILHSGGVIIGKTNLDAFAHGSSTETSDFGPTLNPRNTAHLPGGSSGGSAAAVAADMALAAIGSETAGSIRQPAAWCGVVGMKPTYGRVSRYGLIAMGSSLDCPGPITKCVEDAALLLEIIAGGDPFDATSSPKPVPQYRNALKRGVMGMNIGIC